MGDHTSEYIFLFVSVQTGKGGKRRETERGVHIKRPKKTVTQITVFNPILSMYDEKQIHKKGPHCRKNSQDPEHHHPHHGVVGQVSGEVPCQRQ